MTASDRPREPADSRESSQSQLTPAVQFVKDPVISAIAMLSDEEIKRMSRADVMEMLRLSGETYSTLDQTQQLYAPMERMHYFAKFARDACRQRIASLDPRD